MTSVSRPGLVTDETGNKYGSFIVLGYAGAKRGKALWSLECDLCGHQAIQRGVDLRKGIFPRHRQSSPANFLRELVGIKRRTMAYLHKAKDRRAKQKTRSPQRCLFTITVEDVIALWDKQGGLCAISGMPMAHEFKNLRSASIDRIDSNNGYVPGNIQLVCQWVNYAKNNHSDAEIREVLSEFKAL